MKHARRMSRGGYPVDLSALKPRIVELSAECHTYLRENTRNKRYNLQEFDVDTLTAGFRDFVTWRPNLGYDYAPTAEFLFQEWADKVRAAALNAVDMSNNDILPDDELFDPPYSPWHKRPRRDVRYAIEDYRTEPASAQRSLRF